MRGVEVEQPFEQLYRGGAARVAVDGVEKPRPRTTDWSIASCESDVLLVSNKRGSAEQVLLQQLVTVRKRIMAVAWKCRAVADVKAQLAERC
jgi:hypothetical protein